MLTGARRAAETFARAVSAERPAGGGTVEGPSEVDVDYLTAIGGLGPVDLEATVGEVEVAGAAATAALESTWTLDGSTWTTSGTLDLVRVSADGEGTWRAEWSMSALDGRPRPGDVLAAETTAPSRGAILAAGGEPLATR